MAKKDNVLVRLKPGHPTGEYRRGGEVFIRDNDVRLARKDLPEEIESDPWLIVRDEGEPFRINPDAPAPENPEPLSPDVEVLQTKVKTQETQITTLSQERDDAIAKLSAIDVSALTAKVDAAEQAAAASDAALKTAGEGHTTALAEKDVEIAKLNGRIAELETAAKQDKK